MDILKVLLVNGLSLASLTAASMHANAEPAPAADVTELASMFSEGCIHDFPDMVKLNAFLQAKDATPMATSDLQRYLHSDPGQGWYIKTPSSLYGLTVESPPFHTCTIRRMTPEGATPAGIKILVVAEKAYAASIGGSLVPIKPSSTQSRSNGPDVTSLGFAVLDANGKLIDTIGVFMSNYHGRVPPPWIADGTPGVGVEIRFSRQAIGR